MRWYSRARSITSHQRIVQCKKSKDTGHCHNGSNSDKLQGTNYFQEVDLKKVFDEICEYQAIIRTPEEAPSVIQRAIKIAINQRTVCRIELAADVAEMKAARQEYVHPIERSTSVLVPSQAAVQRVADAINNSDKIGILAGHGCREAREVVLSLSRNEKPQLPILQKQQYS